MRPSIAVTIALSLLPPGAGAQESQLTDVTIEGHIYKPARLEPTDERIAALQVPEGFTVPKFADGLEKPRIIAVADDGTVYVSRRDPGDVLMLTDGNRDGQVDRGEVVAEWPGLHGIAIDGDRMYLAAVTDVFVTDIRDDGTLGELRTIDDLPDGGQHPNWTLAIGPDDRLYITVGSTCNAYQEINPENTTILRADQDGRNRAVFASGLRNTIGFGWYPETGVLYGMDHGIDRLGNEQPDEELNRIEEGRRYGWPYVSGHGVQNPQDEPPEGTTREQWAQQSEEPVLRYTAHAAPMQLQGMPMS